MQGKGKKRQSDDDDAMDADESNGAGMPQSAAMPAPDANGHVEARPVQRTRLSGSVWT
jgi:hypothetical protein